MEITSFLIDNIFLSEYAIYKSIPLKIEFRAYFIRTNVLLGTRIFVVYVGHTVLYFFISGKTARCLRASAPR